MEDNVIKSFILSGCKFQYESYDHKKAAEFYLNEYKGIKFGLGIPQSYDMPDEIKEQFKIYKIGKLRSVDISPIGSIYRAKIGQKYSKTYYCADFGIKVKPILTKKQDKHNLINNNFAILLIK